MTEKYVKKLLKLAAELKGLMEKQIITTTENEAKDLAIFRDELDSKLNYLFGFIEALESEVKDAK